MLYSSGGRPATAFSPMLGITLSSYTQTSMPSRCTFFGANSIHLSGRWPSKRSGGSTTWSSTLTRIMSSALMGTPLSAKQDRQRGRRPKCHAGDVWSVGLGVEAQVREALEDVLEQHLGLHARQVHAETHVRTEREGQMLALLAVDVELLGALPVLLVVIRRTHVDDDNR